MRRFQLCARLRRFQRSYTQGGQCQSSLPDAPTPTTKTSRWGPLDGRAILSVSLPAGYTNSGIATTPSWLVRGRLLSNCVFGLVHSHYRLTPLVQLDATEWGVVVVREKDQPALGNGARIEPFALLDHRQRVKVVARAPRQIEVGAGGYQVAEQNSLAGRRNRG